MGMLSINDIPELKGEYLSRFIERSVLPTAMTFTNQYGTNPEQSPFSTIEWETQFSSGGMTPFTARGSKAPTIGADGVATHSAKAAWMSQSAIIGEEILNELREPGTRQSKMSKQRMLNTLQAKLIRNMQKRREWMFAKMFFDGGFSYSVKGTSTAPEVAAVDYAIPSTHKVTLGTNRNWNGGSNATPFADVFAMKRRITDSLGEGVRPDLYLRGEALEKMFSTSAFADLFKNANISDAQVVADRSGAIATLLGFGRVIEYDNQYEVEVALAAPYSGGTSVSVVDASDFEVGGRLYLKVGTTSAYEFANITAVNVQTGVITIAAAFPTATARAGQLVGMRKYFLDEDKIVAVMPQVDGFGIANMLEAPYGLDGRYGVSMRTKINDDPENVQMFIENLALPVLYFPEAVYILDGVIQ